MKVSTENSRVRKVMNELISVIVPVYKVEKYLSRCIDSILGQTYRKFELILVDDGSPDQCGQICDQYLLQDKRVKVIHKKNGGLSSARNCGIENALGKYIVFIDSDDYVSISYLENLYKAIKCTACDIIQCKFAVISSARDKADKLEFSENDIDIITKDEALNQRRFKVCSWGCIYTARLFRELRFTEGIINEDEDLYYRLIYYSNKIGLLNETLYFYYMSENSIMRNVNIDKKIDFVQVNERRIRFFKEKEEYELLEGSYARYCITLMLFLSSAKINKHNLKDVPILWDNFKRNYKFILKAKHIRMFDKIILTCYRWFPTISSIIICKARG